MEPLRVTASSGRIDVTAEARTDVVVDRGQEHPMGGVLELQGESSGVVMRVPNGTSLVVGTHSGDVRLSGELGEVRITTRSGSVKVDRCQDLDARTVSGRVEVGTVSGDARIRAASGRITVDRVEGSLSATAVSGRMTIGDVIGSVHVTTVQGRIEVSLAGPASARCESVSGAITVNVPRGVAPHASLRSMSGKCACEVSEGTDCEIVGRTVSGRIVIRSRG